ncbi:hypothetical protein O181_110098 [Austropuccinia psidii MF-1]|uniref:Uncharacterized protein n=1 Tax=Austropuccinia psidii MF-1 TaxID=1389203 RepID=A0A9Q3JVZ3_9BASI|nr:hypothetical protein [Austropuccinia psidii MF-1]
MDLEEGIQVINPKDKNVSAEERHKWRIPELPPVPKGNNRDIPVSVQQLVYGGKAAGVGTSSKSLDRHNELLSSKNQKKKLAQGKYNSPVEAPQASTSKNTPQQVPNKDKKNPKNNQKGKQKAKGKAKSKWTKPNPQNHRITKKEKKAMDNAFNMERTLIELKKRRRKD